MSKESPLSAYALSACGAVLAALGTLLVLFAILAAVTWPQWAVLPMRIGAAGLVTMFVGIVFVGMPFLFSWKRRAEA